MRQPFLPFVILVSCALAVGHFAYRTWRPSPVSEYQIGGLLQPLSFPGGRATANDGEQVPAGDQERHKHLYLRRSWHLTGPVEHAWLQVLGHDQLEVIVNGKKVDRTGRASLGRWQGTLVDLTTHLRAGPNAIAIHAAQRLIGRHPEVAIRGSYFRSDGESISLGDPRQWRAAHVHQRRGTFWYEVDFDDQDWVTPLAGEPQSIWAQIDQPPGAVTRVRDSRWITPSTAADGAASFARAFDVSHAPARGWLRIVTNGPYRLSVNGWMIASDYQDLGRALPYRPLERTYDVSTLLRAGQNTVSMSLVTPGEAPRLRADLEITDRLGQPTYLATDRDWRSKPGAVTDWQTPQLETDFSWESCQAEMGYLGVTPWRLAREFVEIEPPALFWLARNLEWLSLIVVVGLLAWLGTSATCQLVRQMSPGFAAPGSTDFVYLSLLPSTLIAGVGILLTHDSALTGYDVYRPIWVLGLALLILVQWLSILALPALVRAGPVRAISTGGSSGWATGWATGLATGAILLTLVCVGSWLRTRTVLEEPVHHDEVGALMLTKSVLETGLPSGQPHPDLPHGYCATSELAYYPTALAALFLDDPRLVLRVPAICWSLATLLLMFFMGKRLFNVQVGLIAATLYALSPHIVGVANFGRYLSQLQFFALLTVWLTYEAVRGVGPLNVRMLWGSALSVVVMYLSWEGSGMIGIALAVAVLFHRRRHLRPLLTNPHIYCATFAVMVVVLGQNAHRMMQQTERMWYGQGITDLSIKPMWQYPFFDANFFLIQTSWLRDALLPMTGLVAAGLLSINHRFRYPLRFLLITLLVNAGMMEGLLPLRANRYAYHLITLTILLSAAALWAGLDAILRTVRRPEFPVLHRTYVRGLVGFALVMTLALASGYGIRTSDLPRFESRAFDVDQLKFPDWDGPVRMMAEQMREGDVVIASHPHIANFIMRYTLGAGDDWGVDYWLESKLVVQATLGDRLDTPLDRRSGAIMIPDLESLQQVFAENERVWYCTNRFGQSRVNDRIVSKYLREHMDVVYEDFTTSLLLRDANHRPAPVRLEEEEAGRVAGEFYLR